MRHHTTDPSKRAEHIADNLQREHESELLQKGMSSYVDWRYWLDSFYRVRAELFFVEE